MISGLNCTFTVMCTSLSHSRPVSTSANSAARPSDGLSGHAQLEIQAESQRLLANARSVLEVESSSTFSRPE